MSIDSILKQLNTINALSNKNIKYIPDIELYGKVEYWTYPERFGDCEDYVLYKRRRLIELGWKPEDLKITICKDETGAGHAVLTVDTEKGTYVLDNRYPNIMTYSALKKIGYVFIMRQQGKAWVSIK